MTAPTEKPSACSAPGPPPPPESSLAPVVTSPDRPAWVQQVYSHVGWDLLNFAARWRLTSAEFVDLLLRLIPDRIRAEVRSERSTDRRPRELGGEPPAMPE